VEKIRGGNVLVPSLYRATIERGLGIYAQNLFIGRGRGLILGRGFVGARIGGRGIILAFNLKHLPLSTEKVLRNIEKEYHLECAKLEKKA